MRLSDLLVDLAAVLSASRSVASKHVALRQQQLDRYGRTSSIAAALRQQQQSGRSRRQLKEGSDTESKTASPNARAQSVTEEHPVHDQTEGTASSTQPIAGSQDNEIPTFRIGRRIPHPPAAGSSPFNRLHQEHPRSNPVHHVSAGKTEFVPAPWAYGEPGPSHRSVPSPGTLDALPKSQTVPVDKDLEDALRRECQHIPYCLVDQES